MAGARRARGWKGGAAGAPWAGVNASGPTWAGRAAGWAAASGVVEAVGRARCTWAGAAALERWRREGRWLLVVLVVVRVMDAMAKQQMERKTPHERGHWPPLPSDGGEGEEGVEELGAAEVFDGSGQGGAIDGEIAQEGAEFHH